MSSTTPPSKSTPDSGMKKTVTTNWSPTANSKSAGSVNQNARAVAADGSEKQRTSTADEQQRLNEVKDLVTAFGPLDGAVKIKLLNSNHYILVHECLLIVQSRFCRAALAKKKGKGVDKEKWLTLPTHSVTTVAFFLRWIYKDSVLPTRERLSMAHADRRLKWPDMVHLWMFASNIGLPKLQNHAVDIIVSKMHSFLELDERTEAEIESIRAAFNLIWRGRHRRQRKAAQREAQEPLRALMMDWFANPLYQTKTDIEHLWDGGISRSFYRDFARHTIDKNFSKAGCDSYDDDDAREHLKAMKDIPQHSLMSLWNIKAEEYYVADNVFESPALDI